LITQGIVEGARAIAFEDSDSKRLDGSQIYFPILVEVSRPCKRRGCSKIVKPEV
jgi:hypothetical protein